MFNFRVSFLISRIMFYQMPVSNTIKFDVHNKVNQYMCQTILQNTFGCNCHYSLWFIDKLEVDISVAHCIH